MNLLLLWAPLADYTVACMKALSAKKDVRISLVYQPKEVNAPYADFNLSFCDQVFEYSEDKQEQIYNFSVDLQPDLIMMSSWNYPLYMRICKTLRKKGTYVISMFDRQWQNTLKQNVGILTSSIFLKPCIDNFFVAGDRQSTFARKLGYPNPMIGYCSANTNIFGKENPLQEGSKKRFIFVGRVIEKKGIGLLLEAYKIYRQTVKNPWDLTILGKGDLEEECRKIEGVQVEGFKQPAELPHYFYTSSCFILPSSFEPWGLVIHEAAICGLPIIATHECGATTFFLRDGQNGYFVDRTHQSVLNAMTKVSSLNADQLLAMSRTSKILGDLWTTAKWADYVFAYIQEAKCQKANEKLV